MHLTPNRVSTTGATAATGTALPTPNAAPIARPALGSPSATLIPASAQTPKLSTKVVNPRPSRIPYSPAATGSGIVHRHASGSWRRIWGTIRLPRASATAAATAITAASTYASRPAP